MVIWRWRSATDLPPAGGNTNAATSADTPVAANNQPETRDRGRGRRTAWRSRHAWEQLWRSCPAVDQDIVAGTIGPWGEWRSQNAAAEAIANKALANANKTVGLSRFAILQGLAGHPPKESSKTAEERYVRDLTNAGCPLYDCKSVARMMC